MLLHNLTIGNLELKSNIFISPIAGYTNLPTRLIYRPQGAGIAYTEMVSVKGLKYSYNKSIKYLSSNTQDTPLGIQLFGPDSVSFLNAYLKIKDLNFDLIDINCGCSVKKVLKANSGADLLKRPDEIYKIIKLIKENCEKPITVKMRSGWNEQTINYLDVLDAAIKGGASLITFHPRTRSSMFKGKADWNLIKIMKEKSPIPVIGNGDIFTGGDAVRMINETKCDGVMVARGLIENPFLIEEVKSALMGYSYSPPSLERRINTMIEHCKMMIEYSDEKKGLMEFRKFVRGYLKGLPNISKVRQVINKIYCFKEFKKTIDEYYHYLLKSITKD